MEELPPPGRRPIEIRIGPEIPILWRVSLAWVIVVTLLGALYLARTVVLPVAVALLLSFLLRPVTRFLHRLKIPEVVGAALVVFSLVAVVASAIVLLAEPARSWADRAPQVLNRIELRLDEVTRTLRKVGEATQQVEQLASMAGDTKAPKVELKGGRLGGALLGRTWELAGSLVVMVFLLYFLLASGDLFLRKLVHVLPHFNEKRKAVEIARHIESDISAYLFTIALINSALGLWVFILMSLLGMPNPVLWGVLAGVLNFIPYLGPALVLIVLGTVALLSFESTAAALLRPAAYLGTTILEGQMITPMIVGRRLELNPVVIFFSLIFWGWLWGIPGALLAVPITMVIKILCDAIPPLSPVGQFLSR